MGARSFAFFKLGWAGRLCVLHAPSGRVVCLGVQSGRGHSVGYPRAGTYWEEATQATAELGFSWQLPTPSLPDAAFDEIEDGLRMSELEAALDGQSDYGGWLDNWGTLGLKVRLSSYLELTSGGLPASPEVWEWYHFRLEAEPDLTYPFSLGRARGDDFDSDNMSEVDLLQHTDDMLHTFLHAATHVSTA
jgi:hypothetical protein